MVPGAGVDAPAAQATRSSLSLFLRADSCTFVAQILPKSIDLPSFK